MSMPAPASAAADRSVCVPEAWSIRGGSLSVARPLVMGVINVTPDSFSDGGRFLRVDAAVRRAEQMVEEGAALLDVGGESTRPGAVPVPVEEEVDRVVPVIREIRRRVSVPVSVDTRKAEVADAAIRAGAAIVNDVSALGDPEMARVVSDADAGVVLMHMRGTPQTMQLEPRYDDVVAEVATELEIALGRALAAGIPAERVVLDPGIGFGKTLDHNLDLLRRLDLIAAIGPPVLLGVSRKAFIGKLLGGAAPDARLWGTVGACVAALGRGARIFRVHDVGPVREALTVADALRDPGGAV